MHYPKCVLVREGERGRERDQGRISQWILLKSLKLQIYDTIKIFFFLSTNYSTTTLKWHSSRSILRHYEDGFIYYTGISFKMFTSKCCGQFDKIINPPAFGCCPLFSWSDTIFPPDTILTPFTANNITSSYLMTGGDTRRNAASRGCEVVVLNVRQTSSFLSDL